MKQKFRNFKIILLVLILSNIFLAQGQMETTSKFPVLRGPYLGQKPPGMTPEIFAPGVVTDISDEHTATMFTADGKEAFWSRIMNPGQHPRCMVIMHVKQENGVWSKPGLAPFNIGTYNFIDSISPDGKRVYFKAFQRIEKGEEITRRWTNWVVHKTDTGWGEPRLLEEDFKWDDKYFDFNETNSGNRYFSSKLPGVEGELGFFRSKYVDGEYQQPEALGKTINSEYLDYAFYVDPDEKFIIFASNRPGGFLGTELYISFHQPDDSWGPAMNLGSKINNSVFAGGTSWPYLSPDGKYLFFIASVEAYQDSYVEDGTYEQLKAISMSIENGYSKTYWVNTSFIEELKPDHLK
jgi:hypothetical protein